MANGLKAPPHPQASEKVLSPKKALINKLRISTQGGVQVELWPRPLGTRKLERSGPGQYHASQSRGLGAGL